MKMAWKSGLRREPVDLLSPNPYYLDVVDRLLGTQKVKQSKPCRVYLNLSRRYHDPPIMTAIVIIIVRSAVSCPSAFAAAKTSKLRTGYTSGRYTTLL